MSNVPRLSTSESRMENQTKSHCELAKLALCFEMNEHDNLDVQRLTGVMGLTGSITDLLNIFYHPFYKQWQNN